MAKWSDFLISGVWLNDERTDITHVMLHVDDYSKIPMGVRLPIKNAIGYIKRLRSVITIRWDYDKGNWIAGEKVIVHDKDGKEMLGTIQDNIITYNLQNLLVYDDNVIKPTSVEYMKPNKIIFKAITSHIINKSDFDAWSNNNFAQNKTYLYLSYVSDILESIYIDESKLHNIHSQMFKDYLDTVVYDFIPKLNEAWLRYVATGVISMFASGLDPRKAVKN